MCKAKMPKKTGDEKRALPVERTIMTVYWSR
jgi:hypothetical protein